MEEWVPIEGFDLYEVSDQGRVRNVNTGAIRKHSDNGHGVLQVTLLRDGRYYTRAVHRLVATAFLGEAINGDVVVFLDSDRTNLHLDNLAWRPRWFAQKRAMQDKRSRPMIDRPVRMLKTGEVFENTLVCARAIDGIEEMIINAAGNAGSYWYKGSFFEYAD